MAYKCPLCLTNLTDADQLFRYCSLCGQNNQISGNIESIKDHLKCHSSKCLSHGNPVEGIYFLHVDCEKLSPFWNDQELVKPDNLDIDGKTITVPFDEGTSKFKHWQVYLLNDSLRFERPEMWFPAMLLRATTETDENGKRFGQAVGLVGTKDAGKTILALQALDNEGYFLPASDNNIVLEDFIYSQRRKGLAIQSIFELLRLRSLMRANIPFPQPSPTLRESENLYTVFFAPTEKALEKKNSDKLPVVHNLSEKYEKTSSFFQRVWEWIAWAFGTGASANRKVKPFWFTLAIYDVAGEEYENETELIKDLSQKVDKIALIVDATDLLGKPEAEAVLANNLDGLKSLRNLQKPFCVILTKMDLFLKHFDIADVSDSKYQYIFDSQGKIVKEMMVRWKEKVKELKPNEFLNLERMLGEIIGLDEATPIFAIATVNLPSDKNDPVTVQPVSYGIDTFVCWSLDIEKDDFIVSRN